MTSQPQFSLVPRTFLRSISSGCDRIPALYYDGCVVLRHYFWLRLRTIFRHILRSGVPRDRCLDFAGGGGAFLLTLSGAFRSVTLIDLVTTEAKAVVEQFELRNVVLVEGDVRTTPLGSFDVVVAADVLEHFKELDAPIRVLRSSVAKNGVLVTSLPTENFVYVFLRKVFGIQKPDDHYHTGYEVERELVAAGFTKRRTSRIPNRFTPLFLISTWTKSD